jgi:CheY-like chemotaxis protein
VCSCPSPQIALTDDEAVNASLLATILQKNGFSAEFFGSAQEALAAAQSKALDLLVSDHTGSGNFGDDCATQMRMMTMNSGQEIDHAYQEERLLALLQKRQRLPATSTLMPDLEVEFMAVWDLVRSCRMVQARKHCEAALEPIEASSNHSPHIQVDDTKNCASQTVRREMQDVPAD